MPVFRCTYCGRFFEPDPRKRGKSRQKTCGRDPCRRLHQLRKYQDWIKRHPGYARGRCLKIRGWAKVYPDYWQRYRQSHPDYVARDNQRRRVAQRLARMSAKQTERRQIFVDKLLTVKATWPQMSAKQTVMARRVDTLVDTLIWHEQSAKQSLMALNPPPGG